MRLSGFRVALTALAVGALALAGCSKHQQARNYQQGYPQQGYAAAPAPMPVNGPMQQVTYPAGAYGVQQCINDGNAPSLCQQSYYNEVSMLPHYGSYYDCLNAYPGDCERHGSLWGPVMAGFMLGNVYGGHYTYPQPVYVGPGGYLYSHGSSLGLRPQTTYYHGRPVLYSPHYIAVSRGSNGSFIPAPAATQQQFASRTRTNGFAPVAQNAALNTPTRASAQQVLSSNSTITTTRPGMTGTGQPATVTTTTTTQYQASNRGNGFGNVARQAALSSPTRPNSAFGGGSVAPAPRSLASVGSGWGGGSSSSRSSGGFGGGGGGHSSGFGGGGRRH